MPRVVKMTITLPENLAHLIEQVMVANNLDRSSAVAFMLSRVNQKDLFPPGYTPPAPAPREEPPGDNR